HRRYPGGRPVYHSGHGRRYRPDLRHRSSADQNLHQHRRRMTRDSHEESVLRFEHVNVSFEGEQVLRDLSFEARTGQSHVILGAAGSGKTVLLKTAMGLIRPETGKVFVFGQDITTMTEHDMFGIRSKIGMLFQESALFDSLNIEENVAYPLLNQKSIQCPAEQVLPRVQEALDFVELGSTLEKFPNELSGGMRRRAAIARAVV